MILTPLQPPVKTVITSLLLLATQHRLVNRPNLNDSSNCALVLTRANDLL
jgi:hypothetical protein